MNIIKNNSIVIKLISILNKFGYKQIITVVFLIFFISSAITSISTYKGYQAHLQLEEQIEIYCEKRFKDFKVGEHITTSTYVNYILSIEDMTFYIRVYPEYFIKIVIISKDFEPRKYWLHGPDYFKKLGIDIDKSILEILLDTWIESEKVIGLGLE